jgi:hypothetical protein
VTSNVLRGSEDAGMFVSTTKNDLEREELEKSHFLRRSEKSIPIDVSINSYNIKSDSSPKKKLRHSLVLAVRNISSSSIRPTHQMLPLSSSSSIPINFTMIDPALQQPSQYNWTFSADGSQHQQSILEPIGISPNVSVPNHLNTGTRSCQCIHSLGSLI